MNLNKVFSIGAAVDSMDGEVWKTKIEDTLSDSYIVPRNVNLGDLLLNVYAAVHKEEMDGNGCYVAYGAGKMAGLYLPILMKNYTFTEVWDAYLNVKVFQGLPVVRPAAGKENVKIVVFIDDNEIRSRVINMLKGMGYKEIFYYRYCLCLTDNIPNLNGLRKHITSRTEEILQEIESYYQLIENGKKPVIYFALPKYLEGEDYDIKGVNLTKLHELFEKLDEVLLFEDQKMGMMRDAQIFLEEMHSNKFSVAVSIELFLREILSGGVKTKERPIRMFRDRPYDSFAIFAALKTVIAWMDGTDYGRLSLAEFLLSLNRGTIELRAVRIYFLNQLGRYSEALGFSREIMHKDSNSLLANEIFYETACLCLKNGIHVEEPVPRVDLKEYFCWSGMNFAWCGGYDRESDKAELSPCFRPLQCAARPEGKFWNSDEWKEFRKSLLDGSFKYCQKNQCPNLVAGWLPRKDRIRDGEIKKIIEGDLDVIPVLEELHFSYDGHCNLKCPSCRTEFQTITKEQADNLDVFYRRHLKEYVQKAKHLCLSGCGEAMISPHSRRLLQSLDPTEFPELEVELRTNMTTITAQAWEGLGEGRKVIRHIAASIDSCKKEDFERIRYPAKWDDVCKNLKFVQELRNHGELDMFEFHVVIQKDNVDQLLDIVKMAISYDADAVTFSRLINWREMPEEEYDEINPFWIGSAYHKRLLKETDRIMEFRDTIENGTCELTKNKKRIYINMHFEPDPSERYDEIRYGRIKIR